VLDVANGFGHSSRRGYVTVETVQFLVGLAVAIVGAALLWSPSSQAPAAEQTPPPPR
jgi:hypothetical protein